MCEPFVFCDLLYPRVEFARIKYDAFVRNNRSSIVFEVVILDKTSNINIMLIENTEKFSSIGDQELQKL